MGHGLLGALNEFMLLSNRAIRVRMKDTAASAQANGPPCIKNLDLEELNTIQSFSEDFISQGMAEANRIILSESLGTISQFTTNNIIVTGISILALISKLHFSAHPVLLTL